MSDASDKFEACRASFLLGVATSLESDDFVQCVRLVWRSREEEGINDPNKSILRTCSLTASYFRVPLDNTTFLHSKGIKSLHYRLVCIAFLLWRVFKCSSFFSLFLQPFAFIGIKNCHLYTCSLTQLVLFNYIDVKIRGLDILSISQFPIVAQHICNLVWNAFVSLSAQFHITIL